MFPYLNFPALDMLQPEEVDARIRAFAERFPFADGDDYSDLPALRDGFAYVQTLIFAREMRRASETLRLLRPHLDKARAENPDDEEILYMLVEWNIIAMRFVLPAGDTFAEYPFYREIEEILADRGDRFHILLLQARIQVRGHYDLWLRGGGDVHVLPEDMRADLAALHEGLLEQIEEEHVALTEAENWALALPLRRSLARFYLQQNKPNEAIGALKALREDLPRLPDAGPVDDGEIALEIGSIFYSFQKYKAAEPYLADAYQALTNAGPDHESAAAQAEVLLEDCRAFAG